MNRLLFVFLGLACTSAQASCVVQTYEVSGLVKDKSGDPVVGALVGVSWVENLQAVGPTITTTNGEGSFEIVVRFHTYTGSTSVGGDHCNGRLHSIAISACSGKSRSIPKSISVDDDRSYSNVSLHLWDDITNAPDRPSCTGG